MGIANFINNLFCRKTISPEKHYEKVIKKLGYKKDKEDFGDNTSYVKKRPGGRIYIWVRKEGIKIKVYVPGYGESDFLPYPIADDETLIKFIRENEF